MEPVSTSVVTTFVASIIGASVMTLLLVSFQRHYPKSYLQHWTFGWAALAAHQIFGAFVPLLGADAAFLTHLFPQILVGIAGLVHITWFSFGVDEWIRRRPVRLRVERNVLIGMVAAGAVTGVLVSTLAEGSAARSLAAGGARSIVGFAAFATCGVALWRSRERREGTGTTVISASFLLAALTQLRDAGLGFGWFHAPTVVLLGSFAYLDFLVQSTLAVGMIACVLEDEREAAAIASQQIEHLAYYDALTGLPNRPLFMDRLIMAIAQAQRTRQKLGVLFLDLDRFKEINDSLGHSTGDQLLRGAAERIRRCVREEDTLARFGGDEFTLLIPRVEKIEDVAKIAQKITETLRIPFVIGERELFATASVGISVYPPDGMDAETLVRNADTAMYRAKEAGRDTYQMYAPAMNARALERLGLENMLRKAVAQNELVLYYQPLIDTETQGVVGFEALTRWRHPELGIVLPAHFIPAAETSGLIIPIGQWVLRTACRQIRVWQRKFGRKLTVSVNLSARQFAQPELVEQVRHAVEESGIDPGSLELEITESSAMSNAENTIHLLRELKRAGVRIAMDDFGTGYSSLNYLKRFPIDTLKLDQMFVRDIVTDASSAAIVRAIVTLSHDLELSVVAEGVETLQQLEFLKKHGCDRIQGFYYSGALPPDEVEAFLTARLSPTLPILRPADTRSAI